MKKIGFVFCMLAFVLFACHKEENKDPQNQEPTVQEDLTMQIHVYPATAQVVENAVSDINGNVYDAVQIGEQLWMAENLTYASINGTHCFEYNLNLCSKYGRLYTWNAASNACPKGWHLPTKDEFITLINAVGGNSIAGKKLKSTDEWEKENDGEDLFGFSVIPASPIKKDSASYYYNDKNSAKLWAYTKDKDKAVYFYFYSGSDYVWFNSEATSSVNSVRCIKD